MSERCELVVIGSGPAGLTAATRAAELGVQVTLIDEQSTLGGQIFRGIEKAVSVNSTSLGQDYLQGAALVDAFRKSDAVYRAQSDIWVVTPERDVGVVSSGVASMVKAERIIVATGSMERAVPFPGWTLPGVMTVGAGQILLKQDGMVPNAGIVMAGSGPLLFLVACQYLRAGVAIQALLDMTPIGNYLRALPHLPMALTAGDYLAKGKALKRELTQAGIQIVTGVSNLAARGSGRIGSVEYTVSGQRPTKICTYLWFILASCRMAILPPHLASVKFGMRANNAGAHRIRWRLTYLWFILASCRMAILPPHLASVKFGMRANNAGAHRSTHGEIRILMGSRLPATVRGSLAQMWRNFQAGLPPLRPRAYLAVSTGSSAIGWPHRYI